MSYRIDITKQAQSDIDFHKKSGNKAILKKINTLFEELTEHPFTGTGKPETLKYELNGFWPAVLTTNIGSFMRLLAM